MAEAWSRIESDHLAEETAAMLWPAYVRAVKEYLRLGMMEGVNAARTYLSHAMREFNILQMDRHEH